MVVIVEFGKIDWGTEIYVDLDTPNPSWYTQEDYIADNVCGTLRLFENDPEKFVKYPLRHDPDSDCGECEKVTLTIDDPIVQEMLRTRKKNVDEEEKLIQAYNEGRLTSDEFYQQYMHRKERITDNFYCTAQNDFYEELLERLPPRAVPGVPPDYYVLFGKQCPKCGKRHFWILQVRSDLEIVGKSKTKPICPKCGKPGSRYVDKRGYVYFQHYFNGKRSVCFIGKETKQKKLM